MRKEFTRVMVARKSGAWRRGEGVMIGEGGDWGKGEWIGRGEGACENKGKLNQGEKREKKERLYRHN